jgi:hypothetical protein
MNPRIPLPTDSIFKFYAMFGLVIMLTTAIMFFIRHEEYNRRAFERHAPMKILEAEKTLDERQKLELYVYEQKSEIDKSNKKFELSIYIFLFIIPGMLLTVYGFYMWHTQIQPKQDMLLDLQLERLKAEIKAANKEVQRTRYTRR